MALETHVTTIGIDIIIGETTSTRGILGGILTITDGTHGEIHIIMAGGILTITDGILGVILTTMDGDQASATLMDSVDTMAIMMEVLDWLITISYTEEEIP